MAFVYAITVGSHVWLEDDELAWVEGDVHEINDTEVTALTRKGNLVYGLLQNVHLRDGDAKPGGVDDMAKLAYLHEPGLLHNLAIRYELDEIYTYTGNILIAVNPFAKLPHLYDAHMMEQYRGSPLGEISPHVFAIADNAYRAMIDKKCSQSILVSGESGAGKTETTKVIMQYLAYMGGRAATDGRSVEQQVLESNPLLEAFGNAKTIRNDNSSRFGKFIEIHFDHSGRISGAAVRTYLLERSRVVQISDPERNYHCFYQLCASPEDAQKYKLSDAATFHYLNQSKCFDLVGISNGREYLKTRRAMDIVGIRAEEQEPIFRILASILHIGNIEFVYGKDAESSKLKDEKSVFHLQTAAELLMCDCQGLQNSLCTRRIATRDENITKTLDPTSATVNRDTLAKTIYSKLFDWLVNKINKSIGQDTSSSNVIGVLDIYGFETFEYNSFEQFCINLANEKLQQHFNQHVFKMEQDDYTKEAINWSYIEFIDNQDVLDLIEGKPLGIIPLLDEACMFPKSTHKTFSTKLFQLLMGHKRFSMPKLAHTDFIISHYAGEVRYQTDLFLEKNRDYIVAEHRALLGSSKCSFVSGLFPPLPGDCTKSSYKFSSIATGFKQQLQALMDTLNSTEPHYIRCVKPNMFNRPGCFDSRNVLQQLRCGGVLEAVRISCAGYPTRRSFDEFLDRFSLLAPEVLEGNYDGKKATEKLLIRMKLSNYQIGKTKIFLRAGQMAELDAKRAAVLTHAAKVIQNQIRTFVARKDFRAMRKAAVCVQAIWRGKIGRKLYDTIHKEAAAVLIQKYVRRWECLKLFQQIRLSVIIIQSGGRGLFARNEYRFKRRTKSSKLIQAHWRGSLARAYYRQLRKAAVTFQCGWRCRTARRELRRLKQAAKETGALQEAKTKLEKRCDELTWRLQLEKRLRTDAEELKTQEVVRLKAYVQEMKGHMDVASNMLQKERMLHKEALERALFASKELSATNTKMKEVMSENSKLKASNFSLERKAFETEQNFYAFRKESEEWQLKANSKIQQLQESTLKLEERFSNLQSENQVLRQQALALSPTNGLNHVHAVAYQWIPTNGHLSNGDFRDIVETPPSVQSAQHRKEVDGMQLKFSTDRQQENQDALLKCVMQDIGFSQDRPVAACIIYKSLLHWRSFEAEKTIVFDRIIQIIGTTIESQENNDVLAYWLSNTSTLLFLLQRTLKASPVAASIQRSRLSTTTLFGHMTQGFRSSPSRATSISSGGTSKGFVKAKYPALLFKQQLTAYVEKIYGLIRDNLKKEITPFLGLCIQAPRNTRASLEKVAIKSLNPNAVTYQSLSSHWGNIIGSLTALLNSLRANHVPSFLVRKLFKQIFSFVNVQLFNSLLLRRECCSFSNGEYIKAGLAELEHWIYEASDEHAGTSWNKLKYIRQAVGFLVIHQKPKKSLDEITDDLCPSLSIQQLYRISTMYWDDKYGTHSVSPEIIASMRILMTNGSNSAVCNSFLLDDDTSIPFTVDKILSSIKEVDLTDMDLPPFLRNNPAFTFLQLQAE